MATIMVSVQQDRRRLALLVVIAVAAASSAAASSGTAVEGKAEATGGSILVVSDGGIYRRDPNGTLKQLTTSPNDQFPAWSRDGTQIAFVRYPADLRERYCPLFVMNSDGTGLRRVGEVKTDCSRAGWGPGDRQLVFGGAPPGGNNATLWVVNVDGSGLRLLLRGRGANPEGAHPSWSPDGRSIVFGWTAGHVNGLLAIRPDGSGLRALVKPRPKHFDRFTQPMWSRGGKRLVFVHVDFDGRRPTRKIVTASARGRHLHTLARLPLNPSETGVPSWSPSGSLIAFSGACARQGCVWTIPSRGGKRQVLMRGLFVQATWGPAGT
jgi:Tol biopolymer transport system component